MTYLVPVRLAREAYLAGEIEAETLETCLDAAYGRHKVAIPAPLQVRAYEYLQRQVRFSGEGTSPVASVFFLADLS